ncbi:MAG: hypothetical protein A2175_02295 [Candidatus Nealsonbacteria bacterium RBG_13_42_11]|uniref:Glycosyl transferase family 1 domain-containing protein n=1 Tax=Candidatus Nealsonbacteria bacterium RBG_13_42_11 TaxID=1801663 RepID=A0A1G2E194_9BACT|nr:MAG: hypothetical protein A2175_02295 [Candidatus Nealsonbacteria bacterium RBG_13_42_11]
MKICFLAGTDSIHSKKWIGYFADRRNEIHCISLTKNKFSIIKNVKFYSLKGFSLKPLDILFNAITVKKLIKKINPDVLHAHYAGVNGVLAALSGFHPFVLTVWGSDILIAPKSNIIKPLIKFSLKKADLITCDGENTREAMINLGIDASKIKIIYFGVNAQKFTISPKNENLIKELRIKNCPVVISLRNLEPIYDLETLVKAVPLVLKEFSEAKFIIIGRGSEEEKLKKLAKDLKITDSIRLLGFISNDKLPKYLRVADIYVSTSLSDGGISASTAEAMASGLPVVITDSGDNKKWIKDGENGFVIPIKNPEILAKKTIYLLKNENIRLKSGEINRKIIEEKYNYYKEMSKMEKIYEEIIKKNQKNLT